MVYISVFEKYTEAFIKHRKDYMSDKDIASELSEASDRFNSPTKTGRDLVASKAKVNVLTTRVGTDLTEEENLKKVA